jgi:hypothetical protein
VLGRKQHRQHVVDGCKREGALILVIKRQVAEVPIGVRNQAAKCEYSPDVLQGGSIDFFVASESCCRLDPIVAGFE